LFAKTDQIKIDQKVYKNYINLTKNFKIQEKNGQKNIQIFFKKILYQIAKIIALKKLKRQIFDEKSRERSRENPEIGRILGNF